MIEIVDNKWRPFIVLHIAEYDWDYTEKGEPKLVDKKPYYFDITAKVTLEAVKKGTNIYYIASGHSEQVMETPEEIIEACDRLITEEQDKKAAEAHKYFEETQARVAATAAALKKDGEK